MNKTYTFNEITTKYVYLIHLHINKKWNEIYYQIEGSYEWEKYPQSYNADTFNESKIVADIQQHFTDDILLEEGEITYTERD